MTPKKYKPSQDEIDDIIACWELTQATSARINTNFKCPCCCLTRILKAQDKKAKTPDWKHTGCACTYKYLDLTGQLIRKPF